MRAHLMERGHITQSDAPRQQNLTKQAIGVCMALIIFAFGQCLITDIAKSNNYPSSQEDSALHNQHSPVHPSSQNSSVNRPDGSELQNSVPSIYNPALRLLDGELRETTLGKPLSKSDRVLAYLAKAELSEPDAWMRDDIRVAWLTVLRCAQNVPDPWRYSFWTYYGTVPEKAIPYWQQRTADREWMLGRVAAYEKSKKQNRPAITYMPKKEGVA